MENVPLLIAFDLLAIMGTSLCFFSKQLSTRLLILLLLLLHLSLSVESISFNESYKLYGEDLVRSSSKITLSEDPISNFYVTQVTLKDPVAIWDSKTGKAADFSTHFRFAADTRHATTYGGGFVFFLAPVGFRFPPNSGGGYLGLYNKYTYSSTTGYSSADQIVHFEFDTGLNGWDPPFYHVGININSLTSSTYTRWEAGSYSWGDTADVWISYDSTTKNLTISWEYGKTSIPSQNTALSYRVDLREVLPQRVTVGFSAATSVYLLEPELYYWDFHSSFNDNIKQTSKNSNGNTKANVVVVAATVSVGGVLIIMGVVAFVIWRLRQNNNHNHN